MLFSISSISATEDMNFNSTLESNNQNIINDISEINLSSLNLDSNDDEILSQGSEFNNGTHVIYVGQNEENGDGSPENPYKNFSLACDGVNDEKANVTINVYEGTYYLGSILKFNCSNIHIQGINSNVIIKNQYNIKGTSTVDGSKQSFGLTSLNGTFSMSNIIVDGSGWTQSNLITPNPKRTTYFFIFYNGLSSNDVIFNNCTFLQYYSMLPQNTLNNNVVHNNKFSFNRCKFEGNIEKTGYFGVCKNNVSFEYCIFNLTNILGLDLGSSSKNYTMNNCWFSQNLLPSYLFYHEAGNIGEYIGMNINKYAIFSISEEKIGDKTYEIIGKLLWNDTSSDGIGNLGNMAVLLMSDTGDLNQTTAILENGTFKVLYTSNSASHKITATLDNAVESIEFQSINISLDSPSITYGDKQNITVTLPSEYNGVIYVTVNNKTYKKDIEFTSVVTIDISDVLPAGTYDVNVTFVDKIDNENCTIYGFNTTTITVSKVSNYEFDATVTDSIYLGDNATVTLNLPNDANGTVSIKIGENEAITFNVNDVININNFVAGANVVNITYNGNEKYDSKSIVKNVVASAKTTITTTNVTTIYNVAKYLVVTLTANGEVLANKTINVVVGTINENLTTNASGQVSIDVSTLAPNTYVANIAFAGDDAYVKSNATAKVIINKIASSLTSPKVSTIYNVAKKLVITLKDVNGNILANKKVSVKVGSISKTLTTNTKGQVAVDISKLTPKTYTAKFTFAKDTIYADSSNTAKVSVSKATPKIIAKETTFKAKTKTKKYTITLKDNKGKVIKKAKVTLKVKGKTYKATTNSKGKATFKITKLSKKGKHTSTIKFAGNNLYKAVTKKGIKLTVKK